MDYDGILQLYTTVNLTNDI